MNGLHDLAVEPEMDAGDGRDFDFLEIARAMGSAAATLSRQQFVRRSCGSARTKASAVSSLPPSKTADLSAPFSRRSRGAERGESLPRPFARSRRGSRRKVRRAGQRERPCGSRVRFERNAFQKTSMPKRASVRSSSSSSALTRTTRQKRSMARGVCLWRLEPIEHGHAAGFERRRPSVCHPRKELPEARARWKACPSARAERRPGTIRSCAAGAGRKPACMIAGAALRIEKEQAVEKFDFASGADALVEIFKVGAAT